MMSEIMDFYEIEVEENRVFIRFSSAMEHIDTACASVLFFLDPKDHGFFPICLP